MIAEMEIQLDATPQAPGTSRSQLHAMKDLLGTRFDDVALVVSELVTNSIKHSRDNQESIDLTVATSEGRVRIEVHDAGPCFDPSRPREEGLGLNIVDVLSESWGVASKDGCTVWAEMSLEESVQT